MAIPIRVLRKQTMTETHILSVLNALTRMGADEFCERCFGLDKLPEADQEDAKNVRGYRAKCVRLLARVLGKPENTVDKWGGRFENMPSDYQQTLSYADAIRIMLQNTPEELVQLFLENLNKTE